MFTRAEYDWNDNGCLFYIEKVSELMSSKKYVALKVMKESLEYNQFSQLCILNYTSCILHATHHCLFL